jgi:enoyl-[acyl-carrier protein] reductase/trans-2-enoyl-CoA reductase (NAD+)
MIIEPKIRSFICTTAHPVGCAENVKQQIDFVKAQGEIKGPKKVLIIGASTGYGLASRIVAAFGANAQTIGVAFEKPANGKRTASAGWYNTAAFEKTTHADGLYAKSINGDAFSNEIKQQTIDLIKRDWQGEVDLIIYSLAAPKRIDADSGEIYSSALKTIGKPFTQKTINVMTGEISAITIEPANQAEIDATTKVMGGEDWQAWLEKLASENLLAKNCKTIAYSYIGPELTFPIYREGTIGTAKKHLEQTAKDIDEKLKDLHGHAYISVNKAMVTQASAAIPIVPLYISLLFKIMKDKGIHEGCIEQMYRMYAKRVYGSDDVITDENNLIRLDDLEMREDVQAAIKQFWANVSTENLAEITDIDGYRRDFHRLFGFKFDKVDYAADVDPAVAIESIE